MFRYGINPLKLRAVFISHLHGDHVFRTLSADLDAGALRTPHAAQDFRSRAAGRNARMPPALLRRNYPTKSNGWKSIRPGTPYCSKTARSRCGAFPCVTASPPPATCSGETAPLNVRRRKSRNTDSRSPGSRPPSQAKIFCSTTETRSPMRN